MLTPISDLSTIVGLCPAAVAGVITIDFLLIARNTSPFDCIYTEVLSTSLVCFPDQVEPYMTCHFRSTRDTTQHVGQKLDAQNAFEQRSR